MGARWAWYAICTEGHVFSNFSGGSDGVCEGKGGCNAPVAREIGCPHAFVDDAVCDCAEEVRKRAPVMVPKGSEAREIVGALRRRCTGCHTGHHAMNCHYDPITADWIEKRWLAGDGPKENSDAKPTQE